MAESQVQGIPELDAVGASTSVPAIPITRAVSSVVLYVPLPIQKVWDIVSDFFGERHGWPTQVKITPLTQNGLTVGARKRVEDKAYPEQLWVIERLLSVNAQEYWFTYTVDEGMEPGITGFDGLLQLFPEHNLVTGEPGRTRVVWSYALLPLEGEESVPRARMEQVRQTLVAYLMGLQHLAFGIGGAAEDSCSSDSESEDDHQEERPSVQLNPAILERQVEEAEELEEPGSKQAVQWNNSRGEEPEAIQQKDQGTQQDATKSHLDEATELPEENQNQNAVAPDDTLFATELSEEVQEEKDNTRQEGETMRDATCSKEETAEAIGELLYVHTRKQAEFRKGDIDVVQ